MWGTGSSVRAGTELGRGAGRGGSPAAAVFRSFGAASRHPARACLCPLRPRHPLQPTRGVTWRGCGGGRRAGVRLARGGLQLWVACGARCSRATPAAPPPPPPHPPSLARRPRPPPPHSTPPHTPGDADASLTARAAGVEVSLSALHAAVASRGGAAAVADASAWPAVAETVGAGRGGAADAIKELYEERLAAFDAAAADTAPRPARRRSSGSRPRAGSRGPAASTASSGADSARKRARPPRPPAGGGGGTPSGAGAGLPPAAAPPKRSRLAGGSAAASAAATPAVSGGSPQQPLADKPPPTSPPPVRVPARTPTATPPRPRPKAATPPPPPELDLPDMLAFVRALAVRGGKAPPGVALSAPGPKLAARLARRARVALRCDRLGEKPKGGAAKRYSLAPGPDGPARRSQRARAVTEIFLPSDWTPRGGRRAHDAAPRLNGAASDSDWSCGSGRSASPDRAARATARAARKCGPSFQAALPPLRERRTRGGVMAARALPAEEAAWIARRVLAPGGLARGAGPAPVVMVGSGADEGAGFTPWAYVVQKSGAPVPDAVAADVGVGAMGAPVGATWSDGEAAAFEAALDAEGRDFLLRGLGQAEEEEESSSSDEEEEEEVEGGGLAEATAAAADGDGDATMLHPPSGEDGLPALVDGDGPPAPSSDEGAPPPPADDGLPPLSRDAAAPMDVDVKPPPEDVETVQPLPPPTLAASPGAKPDAPPPVQPPHSSSPPRPTVIRSPLDCVNYYYNVWKTRATPRARAWYDRREAIAAAAAADAAAAAAAKADDNARRSAVATEAQRRRRMREMVVWARECARAPTGFDRWPSRVTRYRRAARAMANANVAALLAAGEGE